MMQQDAITVITVSSGRRNLLRRAIGSVRAQDYAGPVIHLVVGDDCAERVAGLEAEVGAPDPAGPERSLRIEVVQRPADERGPDSAERGSVYPRLARLLNIGIARAATPWVAFLDDDNEYEPDHLSSLRRFAAARGLGAVHSARAMVWTDGSPYLEPFFPGAPNAEEGARLYRLMCQRGVWVEGTNILKDRADCEQDGFSNSTVMADDDPTFLVDQNLWLVSREILLRHPVPEEFTQAEIDANTCPDDKMLEALMRNGVAFESTGQPSVRYYLGGISNGEERTPSRAAVDSPPIEGKVFSRCPTPTTD